MFEYITMIAVIFEAYPDPDKKQAYLDVANELRLLLKDMKGFISIERFESLSEEHKVLSLSFWENEEAIERWRNVEAHRMGQAEGIKNIFTNYRIRVAPVVRDYTKTSREQAPKDSRKRHDG